MDTVDPTGSIVFTREDEEHNSMPFLDAKFTRNEDRSVKSTMNRKKTHTDQYLNVASHQPKHQKRVVGMLMTRCEMISQRRGQEGRDGAPERSLKCKTNVGHRTKTTGVKWSSHVEGVSERVATAVCLHTTLRPLPPHHPQAPAPTPP